MNRLESILTAGIGPALVSRRRFLQGATGLAAGGAAPAIWAQRQPDSIHDLKGAVRVNGELINSRAVIKAGDTVMTGSDGKVALVRGRDFRVDYLQGDGTTKSSEKLLFPWVRMASST